MMLSSAAVPVIVHSAFAPAVAPTMPCTSAGPIIRPTVETVTMMLRSLMAAPYPSETAAAYRHRRAGSTASECSVGRTDHIGIIPSCIIMPAASGWERNSTIFPSSLARAK